MVQGDDRRIRALLAGIPALIGGLGVGLALMPRGMERELLTLLLVWASFSLPLGIAFGHCVPYEEYEAGA